MSVCLMIMIFWGTLFSPTGFRVGLIPVCFKGNVKRFLWCWYFSADFFFLSFDRNQILLCKYFDGKSLTISHNSMNSTGFLKRSKFHENQHPKSVSKGNMYIFLVGLLYLGLPWSRPCAPSDFCCSHRWLSTIIILGAPHLSVLALCYVLWTVTWRGAGKWEKRKNAFWGASFQIHAKLSWPPSLNVAFVSHFPVPRQQLKASYLLLAGCHSSFQSV